MAGVRFGYLVKGSHVVRGRKDSRPVAPLLGICVVSLKKRRPYVQKVLVFLSGTRC